MPSSWLIEQHKNSQLVTVKKRRKNGSARHLKKVKKWAEGASAFPVSGLQHIERRCGVETANTVGIQSRPPLLIQRECNGEPPANAGGMQDKLFF